MFTNPKKKYFNQMLADADKVIYDLEFKKYCAMNEREVVRRQYDNVQMMLANGTEEQKKEATKTLTDLQKELEAIDGSILGSAPTEKLPNGAQGIDNSLKSWVTRREYIKGFITHNC